MEECSVIRSTAQNFNISFAGIMPSVVEGLVEASKVRVDNLFHGLGGKRVELRRSTEVRAGTTDSYVNVEISDCCIGEPVDVLLNPLGRSDDAPFFSIPRCEDNVALRLPARVCEFLEGTSKLDKDS
ncbi:hypothetical protein SNK03_005708 [Fusarium graminearum]